MRCAERVAPDFTTPGALEMRLYYPKEITVEWLMGLVENGVEEGRYIDFKRAIELKEPAKKLDYAIDLVSFANAGGGNIVYGVAEKKGVAHSLYGISSNDVDSEKRKLIQIAEDWVDPKIPGMEIVALEHDEKSFLILHIPESWNAPHMVCGSEQTLFKKRHGSQNCIMDVDEIRLAFVSRRDELKRFSEYRIDRIKKSLGGSAGMRLSGSAFVFAHVVPLSGIRSLTVLSGDDLQHSVEVFKSEPFSSERSRFNLDGYLHGRIADPEDGFGWYVQVFRNGLMELVDTKSLWYQTRDNFGSDSDRLSRSSHALVEIGDTEILVTNFVKRSIDFLGACQVPAPYFVFLTVVGLSGRILKKQNSTKMQDLMRASSSMTIQEQELHIPEILISSDDIQQISMGLRPLFDILWQASGRKECLNYNSETGIHALLKQS